MLHRAFVVLLAGIFTAAKDFQMGQLTVQQGHPSSAPQAGADYHFPRKASFAALALGSLGVIYGDIGTSPLYAFRVAAAAAIESGPVRRDIVLGVLSLILWALIVVVAIKYVLILLRADNSGEGGTLSLTALKPSSSLSPRVRPGLTPPPASHMVKALG